MAHLHAHTQTLGNQPVLNTGEWQRKAGAGHVSTRQPQVSSPCLPVHPNVYGASHVSACRCASAYVGGNDVYRCMQGLGLARGATPGKPTSAGKDEKVDLADTTHTHTHAHTHTHTHTHTHRLPGQRAYLTGKAALWHSGSARHSNEPPVSTSMTSSVLGLRETRRGIFVPP